MTVHDPTLPRRQPRASIPPCEEGDRPAAPAGDLFSHPREVLNAAWLNGSAKREILAAWASDASAVEGLPAWRMIPGEVLVPIDEILRALQALDQEGLH